MTIEKYSELINKTELSKKTIIKYISNLNSLERETGKTFPKLLDDEEGLWKHINDSTFHEKNQRKYSVISYINTVNLPNTFFIKNTGPEDYVKKKEKEYPTLDSLKKLRTKDEPMYVHLILNLLLNYNALRCDIANIKMENYTENEPRYESGKIIYPTINKQKIKKDIVIELDQVDQNIIAKYDGDYIFETKSKNRSNAFTKFVKSLTEKHLGQILTVTDLRHINTKNNFEKTGITKENLEKLTELTRLNGHSVYTASKHYL